MIDHLTYYYSRGTEPFRSLSALPDADALAIMRRLCDDTPFGKRFKDPVAYLRSRRQTEQWVRESFARKGGRPRAPYPIAMVLGESRWMTRASPDPSLHAEIRIPLSVFGEYDVSFTYPDSMLSLWLSREKPAEYYLPEYHGKVFTLSEILAIVQSKGLPEETWEARLPADLAPYIEAQVWNHEPLAPYRECHTVAPRDSR